jgi:uncharacterized membrane protein (DUF4010 family)
MFLRVIAIVAALNPKLLPWLSPSLVSAAIIGAAFAVYLSYWHRPADTSGKRSEAVGFRNPFKFWSVVGFALFLGAIIVLGRAVSDTLGATGAVIGAVVVGLADVDAIAVSTTRLTPHPLSAVQATLVILAAVASDTVSKIGIGAMISRGWFAIHTAIMAAACLIGGGAAFALTFVFFPR